jgi:L-cystine uptake protein TcyP (sodium:dicarboxylate symporter family)
MQGCAGVFPALLIVYVANTSGTPIDISLIIMSIIVITIGSIGIAGIPGTSTMAASVGLSGVGLGASFAFITPILAIDPIIDMMRTMLNVSGSLTNAIMVDRQLELMDMELYQDMTRKEAEKV